MLHYTIYHRASSTSHPATIFERRSTDKVTESAYKTTTDRRTNERTNGRRMNERMDGWMEDQRTYGRSSPRAPGA